MRLKTKFLLSGAKVLPFVALAITASISANAQDLVSKAKVAMEKVSPDASKFTYEAFDDSVVRVGAPDGAGSVYLSFSGDQVVMGQLYENYQDMVTREERISKERLIEQLPKYNKNDYVEFKAVGEEKGVANVFTDIDCGYCRRLHENIESINEAGVTVRYLPFPRAGVNSQSYEKMVSVFCADDPNETLTAAKAGKPIESSTCENNVATNYKLAQSMGIMATPTGIYSNGESIQGFPGVERFIELAIK